MYFLAWVDLGFAVFLLLSTLVGLMRGVVFELFSLAGWFVAYFAAQWVGPVVLPWVHIGAAGSALNRGVAFASVFVAALVLWSLAARLLRAVIRATPLSPIDRLLGAGFGLCRGVIVLLIVAILIGLSALRNTAPWQQSQGVVWLNTALQALKPLLPPEVSRLLPAALSPTAV